MLPNSLRTPSCDDLVSKFDCTIEVKMSNLMDIIVYLHAWGSKQILSTPLENSTLPNSAFSADIWCKRICSCSHLGHVDGDLAIWPSRSWASCYIHKGTGSLFSIFAKVIFVVLCNCKALFITIVEVNCAGLFYLS